MRAFSQLYDALDRTTRTSAKLAALEAYLRSAPPADAAWALWFLLGKNRERPVRSRPLRAWAAEAAGVPDWLFAECYEAVGDLAETVALLLPEPARPDPPALSDLVHGHWLPLFGAAPGSQHRHLRAAWERLDATQRFLWNKLLTGGFRVGVSRALLVRALANVAGQDPSVIEHRLLGAWQPTPADFARLVGPTDPETSTARAYPFHLAAPLDIPVADLGPTSDWLVEWKWDGVRAQLIRRAQATTLWSRGEEMLSAAFPELVEAGAALPPGTVLDGEIVAWKDGRPLPFHQLQRRLQRGDPPLALQRDVPVRFLAFDLLERDGRDLRAEPLSNRRSALDQVLARAAVLPSPLRDVLVQAELFGPAAPLPDDGPRLGLSPSLAPRDAAHLAGLRNEARARGAEGLMLKSLSSPYASGRPRGSWWKWKLAPYTCDVVLVAAQPGHGRRAGLFTDYTFAVRHESDLLPVAKAYSGLTDAEIDAVDAFVRAHATGRFGPVRSVEPRLVFELAFEGIAASSRHKSGIALRFPRIVRWRRDKTPDDIDQLATLRRLAGLPAEPLLRGTRPAP